MPLYYVISTKHIIVSNDKTNCFDGNNVSLLHVGREAKDRLEDDLNQHSQRLTRIKELMSVTRSEQEVLARHGHFSQPEVRFEYLGQSATMNQQLQQAAAQVDRIAQSTTSTESITQSTVKTKARHGEEEQLSQPEPSYMPITDRERLLRTVSDRLLSREER